MTRRRFTARLLGVLAAPLALVAGRRARSNTVQSAPVDNPARFTLNDSAPLVRLNRDERYEAYWNRCLAHANPPLGMSEQDWNELKALAGKVAAVRRTV